MESRAWFSRAVTTISEEDEEAGEEAVWANAIPPIVSPAKPVAPAAASRDRRSGM
jgi:hypothetical protein